MRLLVVLVFAVLIPACQKAESATAKKRAVAATEVVAAPEEPAGSCGPSCGGSCGGGCDMAAEPEAPPAALPAGAQWTELAVEGMHCNGCAKRIKRALAGVEGVAAVEVDLATKTVRVATIPGTDARAVAAPRIDALGYHVVD